MTVNSTAPQIPIRIVTGYKADREGGKAGDQQGRDQRCLAAQPVAVMAKDKGPDRPSDKADKIDRKRLQYADQRYTDFYIFLIPLYGLSLGMNASQIGMLVGGRSLLAVFLSIHIGVLMDRFGTRRVTLFFVWSAIALAPVFPLVPWFWPLLLLQIVNGGALSLRLVRGADADRAARRGRGRIYRPLQFFRPDRHHRRRRSSSGVAWDLGGAWPAYLIGAAVGMVLTLALLRAPEAEEQRSAAPRRPAGFRLRDVLPRLSDYVRCFALMAIPAVATTMAIIFLRTATKGVQSSLYIVYLHGIGLIGTTIGVAVLRRSRFSAASARCSPAGRCGSATRSARC